MTSRPPQDREPGTRLLDLLSYLLLAVFVLVTLGPALVGRGALIDVDLLTRVAPFSSISGENIGDAITCRSDTLNYYLPGMRAIKAAFWSGDFPTWAPYEVGGVPLASVPNHAALSPLSLPWLLLPLWLAPAFVKLLEILVAVGGMFGFLRRHGVSRGASILAGIVFASSGFMMMWTNWPHTRVAALIPALFWALERTVQQRKALDLVLVAVVCASMLLGGFPAVTLYALTLGAVYVLVRAFTLGERDWRSIGTTVVRTGAGVVLGIGLAAIQILPFVLNLGTLGLEERDAAGVHLPLGLFLTTGVPDSVGLCADYESYSMVNPVEAVGFLGVTALVLVVCALVLRPPSSGDGDRAPRSFLGLALVVVVVLVWIGGPLLSAVQVLPFYSTNSITRAQSVFGFLAAALAGVGIDRLRAGWAAHREESRPRAAWDNSRLLVLVAVIAFGVTVVLRARLDAHRDGYSGHWNQALVVPALFLGVTLVVVLGARFLPMRLRRFAPVVLAILVVAQSTMFARAVLPLSNKANLYPVTPTHTFLREHLAGDRFGASGETLYPASADFYALRTPVGHEFADPRWGDLLDTVASGIQVSPTYSLFPRSFDAAESAGSAVLDQLSVRYWVGTSADVAGTFDPLPAAPDMLTLRRGEVGRCSIAGGALRGVRVVVGRSREVATDRPVVLHVAVHTPTGVREGSRLLDGRLPRGAARVAVLGEDLPDTGRYPVELWLTGARGATLFKGRADELACSGVRPADDGLRLVFAEAGDTVYERLGALPRIRWASRSRIVRDDDVRLEELDRGVADDTVILDDDSPLAAGSSADVTVLSDEPERVEADVDAGGQGYLVVADAVVRDGWTATVDGSQVPVVHGNHAFAAIPVPAGEHRVVLSYDAPGLSAGTLITAGSGLVVLALLGWPWWVRRRTRARSRTTEAIP